MDVTQRPARNNGDSDVQTRRRSAQHLWPGNPVHALHASCKQSRSIVVWSARGVMLLFPCPLAYLVTFASRAPADTPKGDCGHVGCLSACGHKTTHERHHGTSTDDTVVSSRKSTVYCQTSPTKTDGVSESVLFFSQACRWRQQITNVNGNGKRVCATNGIQWRRHNQRSTNEATCAWRKPHGPQSNCRRPSAHQQNAR